MKVDMGGHNEGWGHTERCFAVFIASPNDVESERNAASRVIEDVNRTVGRKVGISLRVRMWERYPPMGQPFMSENFIRDQLEDCDLFIMILNRRLGTPPTPGSAYESGTVQEHTIARGMRSKSRNQKPELFVYFRKISDPSLLADPGEELKRVLGFRREVQATQFCREYASADTFPLELKDHLTEWVLHMAGAIEFGQIEEAKRRALRRFFDLGGRQGHVPSALMVFPPLHYRGQREDATQLFPRMVLEDFQAMHKITKVLSVAGYHDIHSTSTEGYDPMHDRVHNRIFICSRNEIGMRHLNEHAMSKRFDVTVLREGTKKTRAIYWGTATRDSDARILVKSPQSQYLRTQRRGTLWRHSSGKCLAVDFAVLAKFRDPIVEQEPHLGDIKTFHIFGIRGLGTWGAAWYLDKCYADLNRRMKDESHYEALLRVKYWNYRITVEDVSDRDQAFFDRENQAEFIRKQIAEARHPQPHASDRPSTAGRHCRGEHVG